MVSARGVVVALITLGVTACARPVQVGSDPAAATAATLVVANQTDWEVVVELLPEGGTTGALTLGEVQAGAAGAFENVPSGRSFTLRATIPGSTRMLLGPTREFRAGERWEWLLRPGPEWRSP